jgi:hypothetical protein
MQATYKTYEISIEAGGYSLRFVQVVACDIEAAHADVKAMYGDDVVIAATALVS